MGWIAEYDAAVAKDLKKLDRQSQRLIIDYIENRILKAEHPRLFGKPLINDKSGLWRYRVDKYRIICSIEDKRLVVHIIKIGKRDKVYD